MKRLLLILVGVALGVGTPVSLATFKESAGSSGNSITADPDWVAPPVETAVVAKASGGKKGHVKPGGSYYLCASVGADSGNPPSGLQGVTTDLTTLTTGVLSQVLGTVLGGPCAGGPYNRIAGPHTVKAGLANGTQTVSITTKDNDGNTRTSTPSVTVDGSAPVGTTAFSATNGGAIAGKPEANDYLTFTYDEPIDPESIVPNVSWDGSQRSDVFARIIQNNKNDSMDFWRQTAPGVYSQLPVTLTTGTPYMSLGANYVSGTVVFSGSKLEVSGNDVIVRLGTPDAPANLLTVTANSTMTWRTSPLVYDWAGNNPAAQVLTEGGTADKDF
jgi:hypothetical protein